MSRINLAALVISALTSLVHLIAGTLEVTSPLLAWTAPDAVRYELLACWHMVSVVLVATTWLFWRNLGQPLPSFIWQWIALLYGAFTSVFVVLASVLPGPQLWWQLPQWILLLPIALCAAWLARQSNQR